MGDFHWKDGWYFTRLPNGDVLVTKRQVVQERVFLSGGEMRTLPHRSAPAYTHEDEISSAPPFVELERLVIPADEWASIVASVSARGETAGTYDVARALHAG